jgi:hypothetical protein
MTRSERETERDRERERDRQRERECVCVGADDSKQAMHRLEATDTSYSISSEAFRLPMPNKLPRFLALVLSLARTGSESDTRNARHANAQLIRAQQFATPRKSSAYASTTVWREWTLSCQHHRPFPSPTEP